MRRICTYLGSIFAVFEPVLVRPLCLVGLVPIGVMEALLCTVLALWRNSFARCV